MKNSDQPAYPVSKEICEVSSIETYPFGLTKIEYISTELMKAMVSSPALLEVLTHAEIIGDTASERCANKAIEWANVLLKQLDNNESK